MKALTIWQPWATLIAFGEKEYETRHWYTGYRGPLAIHAAKRFKEEQQDILNEPFFQNALWLGDTDSESLPLGCVLCVAELINVFKVENVMLHLTDQEKAFGNFSQGRYAWQLKDIVIFETPVPARGQQGLWDWQESEE